MGIIEFDGVLLCFLQVMEELGPLVESGGLAVGLLDLAQLAEGVVPGAADAGFVAVKAGEGLVGSFAEQVHAGGLFASQGGVDDPGFEAGRAEKFPFGEGDLFDEGEFGVGAGGEVEFALEEELVELEIVFAGEDGGDGAEVVEGGVTRDGLLACLAGRPCRMKGIGAIGGEFSVGDGGRDFGFHGEISFPFREMLTGMTAPALVGCGTLNPIRG